MAKNFDIAIRLLDGLADKVKAQKEFLIVPSLLMGYAAYQTRIFEGGLLPSGGKIQMGYKRTQRGKRIKSGRQVGFVDFNFTGSLKSDIVVNQEELKIEFHGGDDSLELEKANWLDEQFAGSPFEMSDDEVNIIANGVMKDLEGYFNSML